MQWRELLARVPVPLSVNDSDRLIAPRWVRTYESDSWSPFLDLVRPGILFVDVGANIGLYAIAAARRGARVVAVEADPTNASRLRRLAALNRARVQVVEVVAGRERATVPFARRGSPVSTATYLYLTTRTRYVAAPVLPLDDILAPEDGAVLKIDVEGAELDVLEGGRRLLERAKAVLLEVHPPELRARGRSVDELRQFIADSRFTVASLEDGGADGHSRWLLTREDRQ